MNVSKYTIGILIAIIGIIFFSCDGEVKPNKKPTDPSNKEKGGVFNGPGEVLAHWSQIIGNDNSTLDLDAMPLKLVARFILQGSGQKCTEYSLKPISKNGHPTSAKPATERALPTQDASFDITVCQFEMFADWESADLIKNVTSKSVGNFPGPYNIGRKNNDEIVAIGFGDTGTRSRDIVRGTNVGFTKVVADMLKSVPNPDFAIHVGDFRYIDEGLAPDSWQKWKIDFFDPAQALLDEVPVAFSRGNHEQCVLDDGSTYWYGTHWFLFFEPTTSDQVSPCPENTASLMDPWYFDVANKSETLPKLKQRLIMIDNSSEGNDVVQTETKNFKTAMSLSTTMDTWWVLHKPIWENNDKYENIYTQQGLFQAMAGTNCPDTQLCKNGVCQPRAFMSGHSHMYQRVDFDNKIWPVQYVLGHGGVAPLSGSDASQSHIFKSPCITDDNGPSLSNCTCMNKYSGTFDAIYNQNGFLTLTRNKNSLTTQSGWKIENCLVGKVCQEVSKPVATPIPAGN